ncbi:hypothetical protein HOO65_020392 [Ceratocystis lukuohia]|uniref:Uncharacterized protein n=3 Tax=Ceratocystis TaxID=5157 RepID=A0A0F8BNN8_CERFI|nr:hypothetical protein CFO_g3506 [Ceratocystis platani]PHH49915.1 hypothetical protein CFIMG_002944RA [Ceratocystis fimbriata CBS 114723]
MGIIDRIQAKLELMRLEKRYTRHRHRRSTFQTNAVYVDGEYIYQTPNMTGSSTNSHAGSSTNPTGASDMNMGGGFMPNSSANHRHNADVFDAHPNTRPSHHRFESAPISPASLSSQNGSFASSDHQQQRNGSKRSASMQMPAFGGSFVPSVASSSPSTKKPTTPPSSAW